MNGGHFPGLVPVSESDERLNVVIQEHLYYYSIPTPSNQPRPQRSIYRLSVAMTASGISLPMIPWNQSHSPRLITKKWKSVPFAVTAATR